MALLVASSIPAMAENRKGQIFKVKNENRWVASIQSKYFEPYVARQNKDMWCWAASAQMILNYQGVKQATQEKIVEIIKGRDWKGELINDGGNVVEMAQATDGWKIDTCTTIRSKAENYYKKNRKTIDLQALLEDLVNKYPILVGLDNPGYNTGHAWVLTGIVFRRNGDMVDPIKVILRDPWPDNPSRQEMDWDEFYSRINSIVHVYPVETCDIGTLG